MALDGFNFGLYLFIFIFIRLASCRICNGTNYLHHLLHTPEKKTIACELQGGGVNKKLYHLSENSARVGWKLVQGLIEGKGGLRLLRELTYTGIVTMRLLLELTYTDITN